ncbi:MAG: NINE protein [Succinivibrionaceae bacterium]|nr:NINE protein [Succinivibrionaceae bacterium]MDY6336629.1 NINE protein [Succinivibrionaceae bacterium]
MHCSKCGYFQPDNLEGNFCPRCGAPMKKDGFSSDSVTTETSCGSGAGYGQGSAGGSVIAGPHPVDKVLYIIIAFFLGGFGIQEFYSGHVAVGIVCLLLCWTGIPVFWAWIRIIMAILKPSDSSGRITV